MNLLFPMLLIFSLSLLTSAEIKSVEKLILDAKHRREASLKQMEAEYHKQLHQKQEKMVAAMQQPTGPFKDKPTNPDDYDAVVALYHSTNGSNWANNTGWLKGDPCTYPYWYGLYCIEGRVLQINLVYNGLSGSIPADLTKASSLQVLRLYSNVLTGDIPAGIFSMQSLQVLDLNTNSITGTLPSQVSMANLTQLSLYGNSMKGTFPEVFTAPNLQIVEISSNMFTGNLPESFSDAPGLTELVVSRNAFTGTLPSSYGRLVNLNRLWLFYNNFDKPSIPNSYKSLGNLVNFQADGLSGPIPEWLGEWRKLEYLILINGWLTGNFPDSLCNCKNMISLRLFNNSLKGELPDCMCEMRKMTDFEVSDNQFTGEIPDRFDDCKSLETYFVSRNNLTGEFPESLGIPVNLTIIDVSSNGLYGTIPNSINSLKDTIAEFAICFNMFSDIEYGVQDFFNRIKDYTCLFYNNPWSCPLSTDVPKECTAQCSRCNAKGHDSCSACIPSSSCGWCDMGKNCLSGDSQGPDMFYYCPPDDWKVGNC